MVFKFSKPTFQNSAVISSKPVGLLLSGAVLVSGEEFLNTEILWQAVIPIDAKPVPENVSIKAIYIKNEVVFSELDQALNTSDCFDEVKLELCSQANSNQDLANLKWIHSLLDGEDLASSFTTNPQPSTHTKDDLFIRQYLQNNSTPLNLFWKFNFNKPEMSICRASSLSPLFEYQNKHPFLSALKQFVKPPEKPAEQTKITRVLECIGNLEHSLTLGHTVNVFSSINYSDSGKRCLIDQKYKVFGKRFSMVWSARNIKGVEWNSRLRGFNFEGDDGKFVFTAYETLLNVINEGHLVYQFGLDNVFETIKENHRGKKKDVVPSIIKEIFDNENPIKHTMAITADNTNLENLTRSLRVSHTLSTKEDGFLRIYWDVSTDITHGYNCWDFATFNIHSIKFGGVKFTFFKGTQQYKDLLKMLPAGLNLEQSSLIHVKEYTKRKTEPLYEVWQELSS